MKILELREQARKAVGERFYLRDFHGEAMKDGPVPLPLLEDKAQRWVIGTHGRSWNV